MKDQTIIIRVDKDTKEKLNKIAKENNRVPSDYARLVIQEAINKKKKI